MCMHFVVLLLLSLSSLFFGSVVFTITSGSAWNNLFFKFAKKGGTKLPYQHSLLGFIYLFWLLFGFFLSFPLFSNGDIQTNASISQTFTFVTYDIVLGIFGILLTLSAARDFPHKNVKNHASGTLDNHATVTQDEMIEHSFYQILNLIQILFIHSISFMINHILILLLCMLATFPWQFRHRFPVHSFSANYSQENADTKSTFMVKVLYRIKKYQYVFYKHFLLHGLNISLALQYTITNSPSLALDPYFRFYWLLLNTAYVMEFFLQTLVKKGYLLQSSMLAMQKVLMLASSIAAIDVMWRKVLWLPCLLSLVLNFTWRGRDLQHTTTVLIFLYALQELHIL
mmetsp:Transcript_25027/g.35951  ORF Transcript_25027/g.35951 Transcript_25027/m.35951 type:complete len:341 (+) Transcript_25027:1905-2927(+)